MDIQVDIQENAPEEIEIIIDEFASQRAVDAMNAAQDILDNIQEIVGGINLPNILISVNIVKNGNVYTIQVTWRINGAEYQSQLVTQIFPEAEDLKRIDRIVATDQGTLVKRIGEASGDVAYPPQIDELHEIEVTRFDIYGENVGEPSAPIEGNNAVTKESQGLYNEMGVGTVQLVFQANGANKYLIRNATRVDGWKFAITPEQQQSGWAGKHFYITNKTNADLPLTRNKFGIIKLLWPSEGDMILPKDATAMFYYATEMHLVGNEFNKSKPQKTVTGNVTVDNSWNGAIVKVKATATITFPAGLVPGLEFDYATFTGAIATLLQAPGVTLNSPNGLILEENKMGTIFNDTLNVYEVRGEQNS